MKRLFNFAVLSVISALSGSMAFAEVPNIRSFSPIGMERGKEVTVEVSGDELGEVHQVLFYSPGLEAKEIKSVDKKKVTFKVVASNEAECDLHAFRLVTKNGLSNLRLFSVSPLPSVDEKEGNNKFDEAQLIKLNSSVNGNVQSEDVDYFAVEVPQGEMISVELEGLRHNALNNMFDPFVAIYDDQGKELASNDDATLVQQDCVCGVIAPHNGRYIIEVRDASYAGSREALYRLHVGNFARPVAIYPAGGRPGELLKATCIDSIGNTWEESFQLPKDPTQKFKVWSNRGKVIPPSPNFLRVGVLDNVLEVEPNESFENLPVIESFPAAMNGCLQTPGDRDSFVFSAKKDQTLEFRLVARDILRSPVDGVVEVNKFKGGRLASNDDSGGPDSAFSFKAPEDGKYVVVVKNHLLKGGPQFVYRLEATPPTPKLTTNIKEQERYVSQTIVVPRGARMAVDVLLDRKNVSGDAQIVIPDLPPGLEQLAAVVNEKTNHVQLMLRAKPDAQNLGKLVNLTARIKNDKVDVVGYLDQRTQIVRGQNNRDVWGINSDKLAVSINEPVPFDIEVVQPQVPLVRDGTMPLLVKLKRNPGFTRSVRLKVLDAPPGVTASTSVAIAEGQNQVELPLTANGKASIGKWPVTILATTKVGDNSTVTIASEFIDVEIQDRLFDFEFTKTMAEVGKPAKVVIGVDLIREVNGKVEVEVVGAPPGTTVEQAKLPLAKDAKKLTYNLNIPATAKAGSYKTIACRGTVTSDQGVITQVNGTGEVQIDPPRPSAKDKKPVVSDKPLTRLEELRKQREEQK